MLKPYPMRFSIPAEDLARAKTWYAEKLGLEPTAEHQFGLEYRFADTYFAVVPSPDAGKVTHSLMTWLVDDIEVRKAELEANGVVFEEYNFPFLKTENGIANIMGDLLAYFKDSEGNLLAIGQLKRTE